MDGGGLLLFRGPDGAGKKIAVDVIAADLGVEILRVDLATVVSKYIGETEKNLRRLFVSAKASGAILLFDEADALFDKRREVRDAHLRNANIEASDVARLIEGFGGVAILASKRRADIDRAFLRRLRHVVEFPTA